MQSSSPSALDSVANRLKGSPSHLHVHLIVCPSAYRKLGTDWAGVTVTVAVTVGPFQSGDE